MIDNNNYKDIFFETTANYGKLIHINHPNDLLDLANMCDNGALAIDDYSGVVYIMSNNHWHSVLEPRKKSSHVPAPCF